MSCRIRARGFDGSKATLPELSSGSLATSSDLILTPSLLRRVLV